MQGRCVGANVEVRTQDLYVAANEEDNQNRCA